jgi:hypothetical protein
LKLLEPACEQSGYQTARQNSIMQNEDVDLCAVLGEIELAFKKVRRGTGVTLHEAEVIDDHGSDAHRAKARTQDTEKRWQDVPDRDIENHYSVLSFMDAEGFRYYIPAYMSWTLRNFATSSSLSCDMTIYALTPSNHQKIADWQRERWQLLDASQSKAVLSFLKYMLKNADGRADDSAAYAAIADYWGRFDSSE